MSNIWKRFWSKVSIQLDGCWLWTAGKFSNGYGLFSLGTKPRSNALAHRFSYQQLVGKIPEGRDLDHLCRVRHCVNPAHLEAVTRSENLRRGKKRTLKTHCKYGHALNEGNLYVKDNKRHCKICRRNRKKEWRLTNIQEYRILDAERHRESRRKAAGGTVMIPNKNKIYCPKGHQYDFTDSNGNRRCRICMRENNQRAYLKRKGRLIS